ncbi:MAG: c-type cytochrome [Methylococcales bacterium]
MKASRRDSLFSLSLWERAGVRETAHVASGFHIPGRRSRHERLGYFLALVLVAGHASITYGAGDVHAGKSKTAACGGCHGSDGNSLTPAFPRLAGQHEKYITRQLADFKSGKRENPVMTSMAAGLSDQDMQDIGAFFSTQKPVYPKVDPRQDQDSQETSTDPETIAKGKILFLAGNEKSQLPACSGCHGPAANGNGLAGFPKLQGQFLPYLVKSLNDFKDGLRRNDEGETMRTIAAKMSKAEIDAVSAYLSDLR